MKDERRKTTAPAPYGQERRAAPMMRAPAPPNWPGNIANRSKENVRLFHQAFGHPVARHPTEATPELRALRVRLIAEELCEFARASGMQVILNSNFSEATEMVDVQSINEEYLKVDLVEMADALGDLDYVVQGANLVFGFPSEEIHEEIQRSNMSKLGADGKPIYRDDGKILKGPGYFKPGIAAIMDKANLNTGA
jgi:predicted HAD superfamily Cof-like phosphohydrolase